MAPTAPVGREAALKLVEDGDLPFSVGSPHPTVMVLQQEGKFRIRELVINQAEAVAASQLAQRARSPSWMPEHHYALGRPTGQIYAEAETRQELIAKMKAMSWPDNW